MKTSYQLDVVSRVKKLREERGVSQARMAQELGISPGQMGNIECYDTAHKYTIRQLAVVCKVLNTNMAQLFGKDENMSVDDLVECLVKSILGQSTMMRLYRSLWQTWE